MSPAKKAKLFWTGRSQAVRLPRDFRFEGKEVLIRREGASVILEPVERTWPSDYWEVFGELSAEVEREQPQAPESREDLFP